MRKPVKHKLHNSLLTVSMIGYVAVIIVMIILDYSVIYNYNTQADRDGARILQECAEQMNRAMQTVDEMGVEIFADSIHFHYLTTETDPTKNYPNIYQLIEQGRNQIQHSTDFDGMVILTNSGKDRRYVFAESVDSRQRGFIVDSLVKMQKNDPNIQTGTVLCTQDRVYYVRMMARGKAAICCVTDLTGIGQNLEQMQTYYSFLIVNNGLVLNHKELAEQVDLIHSVKQARRLPVRTQEGRIYALDLQTRGWRLYLLDTTRGPLTLAHTLLLLTTILIVVFVFLLYRFLQKKILQPLKGMTTGMIRIREGEQQAKLDQTGDYAEFEDMRDAFNSLMEEIEQLKISSYEEQIAKQNAQMQCFQLQLRPHFYLNCLKSLNYMAMAGDTEHMQELILSISQHMRYLLKNNAEQVTVAEELENVRAYLKLQDLISSRSVETSIKADEETMQCAVPILCIQTFVENSIKYAVPADTEDGLKVDIHVTLLPSGEGQLLDVCVSDNGKGYSQEILDEINGSAIRTDGRAIGISNIRERCRLLYAEKAQLMFYNMPGAVSELILPVVPAPEEKH